MTTFPAAASGTDGAGSPYSPPRRLRRAAALGRLRHWEFWPTWAVYLPQIPHLLWLAARYGPTTAALCNPSIPLGGLVGESKWATLASMPAEWVVPSAFIAPGDAAARFEALQTVIADRGWSFPMVLKPDQGERGTGVRVIHTSEQARGYLAQTGGGVIAQAFHPGPHEVGVFYTRHPDEAAGSIFSITAKAFPAVVGDGRASLRRLIWEHPRFRMQAAAHLERLGPKADAVPAHGQTVSLEAIGNHCRGTMFLDGSHLITPELTATIDAIAKATPGFFFGRFDIRYASDEDLRAGRNFKILELNGMTSESTNIYDPSCGFWQGQRVLRAQWRRAYQIGAANRRRGFTPPSIARVLRAWRTGRPD